MSGYDIFLSNGDLLTTVNVKTVDEQANSSLVLIGQGIPNYGAEIAQDFVWMLENFSSSTPPVNPLTGQEWHDRTTKHLTFYDGTDWLPLLTARSSCTGLFDMLVTATDIDFSSAGTTAIFTGDTSRSYYPTFMLLIPNGSVSATVMPTFNVRVSTAGDIIVSQTIGAASASRFSRVPANSMPAIISGTATASIQITSAASGGRLHYDVYLFGLTI